MTSYANTLFTTTVIDRNHSDGKSPQRSNTVGVVAATPGYDGDVLITCWA